MKRYVFDLDGTLFDTRDRVRHAYARAGVIMPDEAWGRPASAWLPIVCGKNWTSVHARKNDIYLRSLREDPPARTSAASAMVNLALSGVETYVITGASREAASLLLRSFQSYHYRFLGAACDLSMKVTRIKMLNGRPLDLVYVDDDIDACIAMARLGHRVIRYSFTTTTEEVMMPWAQSSLQPDEANG